MKASFQCCGESRKGNKVTVTVNSTFYFDPLDSEVFRTAHCHAGSLFWKCN